jgi:hypothetical protein
VNSGAPRSLSRLLVVLSSDPGGPVVRQRWGLFAEDLEREGVLLEVVPWRKDRAARHEALDRAEVADGVVVSSRLLRRGDTRRLRRRARRLAFDFDDALPLRDSGRGATPSRTRRRRFDALVAASDLVIAGNAHLAGLAGEAFVLPTVVDVPEGPVAPEPALPPPVFGWIGSRATVPYLEGAWPALAALVASGRPIRLRVVADRAPRMPPGIAVDLVPWSEAGWRSALERTHLGLAPLPEDAWTAGKCGLKVLQTMSLGRPVVASAVGVQREQVRHGETGFLAADHAAFLRGLLDLLEDDGRRRAMGEAAREDVRRRWSRAAWAPRLLERLDRWLA